MLICCTKKLQEEAGIKPEDLSEENDLFCWSAHVLTIMRRKAVAVFNDSNRFGFVMYGVKAKDFKNLETLILQGIKRCLLKEKVKEEIVEQYLSMAGEVHFSKTRGPKYVSRINKACEFLPYLEDSADLKELYQNRMTKKINRDLVKVDSKNNYDRPVELLVNDLEKLFGEDIIQKAFGWADCHMHDFNIFNETGDFLVKVVSDYDDVIELHQNSNMVFESEVLISDYIKNGYRISYVYDFGDNWNHEITIENIITDYNKGYPTCIGGVGDAPPEDVGGVPGYEEFLEIMKNPQHPEYENTKRWAGSLLRKSFDIDFINRVLKYM